MEKKHVAKNYIYNLIYQILVLILPLITTPYLSRVLGPEGIGIYGYTLSIVTFFILFGSLGISIYIQREIAYVQNDKEKRSKIFWEVVCLRAITLTLSMFIFYFMFGRHGEYSIYFRILLLEILASIFDISPFFQGMEEFKKIIKRNLIIKCISIISIFLFIKKPTDINIYLLIYVLSNFLGNISLWLYLPQYIKKVDIKSLNLLQHLKPTISLFIPQIAAQVYLVLDKAMLGTLVFDKAEVGYYEQSQKIIKILMTIATSLGTIMLPRIANDFANGKENEIKSSITKSFRFTYFLSFPIMFGLISVAKDLIPWFLGQGYEKAIGVTYLMSPIIVIIGISSVIGTQYLLPTKRQKSFTNSVVLGAIANLILNFVFIPQYFSIGATIGTLIAETIVTVIQLYSIRKEFNIKTILFMSKKYFLSSIGMVIILFVCNKLLLNNLSAVYRMALDVCVGAGSYCIILFALKDEFFEDLINTALSFIKIKRWRCK